MLENDNSKLINTIIILSHLIVLMTCGAIIGFLLFNVAQAVYLLITDGAFPRWNLIAILMKVVRGI